MSGTDDAPAVVRRATEGDIPALGRLGELLVRTHHALDAARFVAPTPGTASGYAGFLGSQLDAPDVVVLVADRKGLLVGYVYAGIEGTDWMSLRGPAGVVHDIVVDEPLRGRGVGRLLLEAAIAELKGRGAPRVVLSTAARNVDAQRLFASAGFRRTMVEMTRELHGEHDGPGQPSEALRKQYYFRTSERGLLAWDVDRLVELSRALPRVRVPLGELRALDEQWSGDGEEQTWREMLAHLRLVEAADLSWPIILSAAGEVMDGRHRLVKAALLNQSHILTVRFTTDPEPDHVGKAPEELPY